MQNKSHNSKNSSERSKQSAGEFSSWLHDTRRALQLKNIGADVPCGSCKGCCRSSMFIHIKPDETRSLKRIPKELQFPAPGLPTGNVLLGYNERGECPMLVDNKCSIYEDRPQTCRDYDCRVFTATGIALDEVAQPIIAEQVRRWKFDYPNEIDHREQSAVQNAARFLCDHRDSLPPESLPDSPTHLAILAIRVYDVFARFQEGAGNIKPSQSNTEVAREVLEAMRKLEIGTQKPSVEK